MLNTQNNSPPDFSFDGSLVVIEPKSNPYQHLKCVSGTPFSRTFANSGPNFYYRYDPDWLEFKNSGADIDVIERDADYAQVRERLDNVSLSISKLDVPRIEPEGLVYEKAYSVLKAMLNGFWGRAVNRIDEVVFNTSPGYPWIKYRFKNKRIYWGKRDVLTDMNARRRLGKFVMNFEKYPLINTLNSKQETLSKEDLDRNKIRTTFGASLQQIMLENLAFRQQNEWIKQNHKRLWIKYGCTKQYGGFNNMVKELDQFPFVWDSDCSGWDRVTYLSIVYRLRRECWEGPVELFNYLERYVLEPLFLNPLDGNIYQRLTGVCSGSLNTTVDNSIKHLFIIIYMLVKRLIEIGKHVDVTALTRNSCFLIYSDDKTGGIDLDFFQWSPEELLTYEKSVYAEFGLVIKPTAQFSTLRHDLREKISIQHSFLGSHFKWCEEYDSYEPFPRVGKVATSLMCLEGEQLDPVNKMLKTFSLAILMRPLPKHLMIALNYLKFLKTKYPVEYLDFLSIYSDFQIDEQGVNHYFPYLTFGLEGQE